MNPKVSIVIPVYNGSNYMREAIDSALNQTYSNIEVIVVNDGSVDNTEEIALSYGDKIRYFSKENGGVASALNEGIKKMTGEYFQYLPHDDLIVPTKIEKQIHALAERGADKGICWCGWNRYYGEDSFEKNEITQEFRDISKLETDVYPMLFSQINTVSVLIHKSFFEREGLFNESLWTSQDYDMWFRTFKNQRTVYVDECLVNYRFHEEQGTQVDHQFLENCKALSKEYVEKITEDRMTNMFGSKYMFYYSMYYFYSMVEWNELANYMLKQLNTVSYKRDKENAKKSVINLLGGNGNYVVYGAGKNAAKIKLLLEDRGVMVSKLCDRDKNKQGTKIMGIDCVDIDSVDRNSVILISPDNGNVIKNDLGKRGFNNIQLFDDFGSKLFAIPAYI